MGLLVEEYNPNYSGTRARRCVNCGKELQIEKGLYSRLFCTNSCKEEYFSPIGTV